ncbi:MAG: NTPase [Candidatus Natronoplasma sp.]
MDSKKKNNVFITGPPRSGKSTLISEVIDELDLKAEGLRTPEVREGGKRKGFKLLDVKTGEEGILAHVDLEEGPEVSKYTVNKTDLERFTEKSLNSVSQDCDIVVIDEIGTMELFSTKFKDAVENLLKNEVPVLAVLHRNHTDEYGKSGEILDLGKEDYAGVKKKVKEILS